MNTYEAMILLDNREVKKGWDPLKKTVDSLLEKNGAEIAVAKRWDERKLAYEIKKQRRATYYLAYFKVEPEKIVEINRDLHLSAPVLRHLLLRVEEIPPEAYEPEKSFDLEATEAPAKPSPSEEGRTPALEEAEPRTQPGDPGKGAPAEGPSGEEASEVKGPSAREEASKEKEPSPREEAPEEKEPSHGEDEKGVS